MKRVVLFIFFILITLTSTLIAQDNNVLPIRVGIVELEFWGEKDPQTGSLVGIYPTIINELFKRMNLKTEQVLAPYPRIMQGIKTGDFDMTITLPDNDPTLIIGEQVWSIKLGILSKKENPVVSLDQLTGMKVGIIRGAKFEPNFDSDKSIDKFESVQHRNLLDMLENNHIDAIASDLTILNGLIKISGKSASHYADQVVVNELSLHVMLSVNSPYLHLNKEINKTILEMINDGTIEEIIFQFIE